MSESCGDDARAVAVAAEPKNMVTNMNTLNQVNWHLLEEVIANYGKTAAGQRVRWVGTNPSKATPYCIGVAYVS